MMGDYFIFSEGFWELKNARRKGFKFFINIL